MEQLEPAGVLDALASYFFPKRLHVTVRTEVLLNGLVEVTPRYTLNDEEVSPELIRATARQRVLGYTISMDDVVLDVHRLTRGRPIHLSKHKAAYFVKELLSHGIPVHRRDGIEPVRIQTALPDVSLRLNSDDSLSVHTKLRSEDGRVLSKPPSISAVKEDDGWHSVGDDLYRIEITNTPLDKIVIQEGCDGRLQGSDVPRFLKLIAERSSCLGHVERDESLEQLSVFGGKYDHVAYVDGNADSISIEPALAFHGTEGRRYLQKANALNRFDIGKAEFQRISEGWIEVTPEIIAKYRQASEELASKVGDFTHIHGQRIPEVLHALNQSSQSTSHWSNPWAVYFTEPVRDSHKVIDSPSHAEFQLNIVESDGRSLLELDPIYNHDRFQVSHADVEKAVLEGAKWIRRRGAWIKVDSEKYKKIAFKAQSAGLERSESGYTFAATDREQVINLFSTLGSIRQSAAYADFLAKLADFSKIEDVPLPSALRREISLRQYQKHGYNWLAFLHRFGLNGILADDMGLGKTLQTLAVIQRARELTDDHLPSLIICPTSVVNNWRSEVGKFFSEWPVINYTGDMRHGRLRTLAENDGRYKRSPLVVTSYDIARIDRDRLSQIPWMYVVVDEGHNIKNPDAKRTKAIKTINGRHKLALTGTPIQNNLEELWSLFDYAMPGYLGTRQSFQLKYARNGQATAGTGRVELTSLKDRIHPFVLRRLKDTVAKDLPPKNTVLQPVELKPVQVRLYKSIIGSPEHRQIMAEIDAKGVRRSKLLILAAFAKLRNVCNHPGLVQPNRNVASLKYDDSGKLECLKELIEEIIDGEHRTLLFCQSTQMLDIIEHFFQKWKVRNLRLDGTTPVNKRSVLVDQFNGDSSIHCFLISTKAGGTGLNLTGADTVIFYDHDWNPANDNQARDRAHRIGQTKPVTVYKLVSKGTIEEKILQRQAAKQSLADEIIGADDEGFKDLSKEDLLALFTLEEDNAR